METERTDGFNAAVQGASSKIQIEALDKKRTKPKPTLDLTPSGAEWVYKISQREKEKNLDINKKTRFMQRRLKRRKNQLKKSYENTKGMGGQGLGR